MDVESCFGQSSVLFTSAVYIVCPFSSYSDLWAQPPPFAFLPFLLVLDIKGFCFLWHPPFLIFWRGGQKKGWRIESLWRKVFGGHFWIMFTRHKLLTVWTWHVVNEIYFHDDYFYTPTIREPTAHYHRKKKIFLPIWYTQHNTKHFSCTY